MKNFTYTYDGGLHSKTDFLYDENKNLLKKIDSTGFYTKNPIHTLTTQFQYNNDGKIEIKKNLTDTSIHIYNLENKLISEEYINLYSNEKQKLIYVYLPDKQIISSESKKLTTRIEYAFNNLGLLKEVKMYMNAILFDLKRCYYE